MMAAWSSIPRRQKAAAAAEAAAADTPLDATGAQVRAFYDGLSADYTSIFADWDATIDRQAGIITSLIAKHYRSGDGAAPRAGTLSVLDCACGIGTQAIGLAKHYPDIAEGATPTPTFTRVHGTDISAKAVERARVEAAARGAPEVPSGDGTSATRCPLTWGVADFRHLSTAVAGTFDVVLAFDNALPHMLSDEDLAASLAGMRAKCRRGALCMVSIRDYDALLETRPPGTYATTIKPGTAGSGGSASAASSAGAGASSAPVSSSDGYTFQVWEYPPPEETGGVQVYRLKHVVMRRHTGKALAGASDGDGDGGGGGGGGEGTSLFDVAERSCTYRCLRRAELTALATAAGFEGVEWLAPEESGFYQPIMVAHAAR